MSISFSDKLLPIEFSLGAVGGPEFSTNILGMANGAEQRNINWKYGRCRYDLFPALRSSDKLEELLSFFRVHLGRAVGFRMRDWADCKITKGFVAVADGKTAEFQLVKRYVVSDMERVRLIRKPCKGSVMVFVDDALSNPVCDYNSGKITFAFAPPKDSIITCSLDFDIPVRFDTDYLEINLDAVNGKNCVIPVVEIV